VAQILNLNEDELSIIMPNQNRSKFSYRLAWARSYLKRYGLLDNTQRGVWTFTKKGKETKEVDKDEVNRVAKAISAKISKKKKDEEYDETTKELSWKDELLKTVKDIPPDAFERLCQRFLRESGFVQVEVTGRSGDGGIDGHGVVKIGGLLSFHVYFQAKRYKGSVTASVIRDFRGAMVGRADKGLIITTGVFTRDAKKGAQRDGATPIDLIDGDELAQGLKELDLGVAVKERVVEEVTIVNEWFEEI
jgi:restriction system protein